MAPLTSAFPFPFTRKHGLVMPAVISGKNRMPRPPPRTTRGGVHRLFAKVIISSNATVLPHAAAGADSAHRSLGFGAHRHALRHPRSRSDHPQAGRNDSARG